MSLTRAIRSEKSVSYVPLQKLSQPLGNSAILVRVSRLWDAYNLKNNTELLSTHMVLIDQEGSYIHGSIKGNSVHLFRDVIVEGQIYSIANFEILENRTRFRVVGDNKHMIQINSESTVKPARGQLPNIAMHRFDLLDFDKVPMRKGLDYILTDVVGQVCSEGDVINKNVYDHTVKSLMLELQDLRGAKMRITLWGKSVDDYTTQKAPLLGSVIVGVFTSNLVKEYMKATTLSSTTATKVFLDVSIDEVAALKNKYSDQFQMKPLLVHKPVVDRDTVLSGLKTIAEILNIASGDFKTGAQYYCHAIIEDISNKNGWYYNSCGECKGIVKPSGTKFWYRLEAMVKDKTEVTKFVIFDEEAEKLIGQSAISLYDMEDKNEDEDSQGQLPALIGNLIGQTYVFHVRLTEYNRTAYTQSFGASKVYNESILGPMENKETHEHASTSIPTSSPVTEENSNKRRRLSENTDAAIPTP